jgi:hypothetical protein
MNSMIKQNLADYLDPTIVRNESNKFMIVVADIPENEYGALYPFFHGEHLLFMGEISNMRGHVIVVNKHGQTFWGYHADNFVILSEDEV